MRCHLVALAGVLAAAACGGSSGSPPAPDGVRSGQRLRARFQQEAGEGGARELLGWHDQARDEDCAFARASDGSWRCVPPVQWSETFRDETCTTPLGTGPIGDACWVGTPYLGRASLGGCNAELEALWEIGARTLPAMVYLRDETGACTAAAPDPGIAYYAAGAEVPLDAFAAATLLREDGPTRLDHGVLVGDDGAHQPLQLHDGELGARCWMWLLPDEERWHCLPIGNGIAYWSDAACSTPVAAAEVACVLEEPLAYVSQTVSDACGYTIRIFDRGPELSAPTLFRGDAATCAEVPAPDDEVWYQVGAEVARDTFATAEKVPGDETGRLRGLFLSTPDGFLHRAGGYLDTARAEECLSGRTTDGTTRCLPANFATLATFYGDAACTTVVPVFEQSFGACKPPPPASVGIEYLIDGCDTRIRLHGLGAELASGAIYTVGDAGCVPFAWDATTVRYYAAGAEVPPTDFVELVEVVE